MSDRSEALADVLHVFGTLSPRDQEWLRKQLARLDLHELWDVVMESFVLPYLPDTEDPDAK